MHQIDALRVLSMFFVCILHIGGGFGGLASATNYLDKGLVLLLLAFADVSVNCFMMISGYVLWRKEWRLSRYVALWAQVAFYTIGFVILVGIVNLMTQGHIGISWSQLCSLFLPVPFASMSWYFTAYTCVFLLSPAMNLLQARLSQRQMLTFILICMALVSIFAPLPHGDSHWGFSTAWFCIMYMAGSYLREYPVKVNKVKGWIFVLLGTILNAICCGGSIWLGKHGVHLPYFPFDYAFPVTAVQSIVFFVIFANMEIKSEFLRRWIAVLAPLTFGVLLIHGHLLIAPYTQRLCTAVSSMLPCSFASVVVAAVLVYALSSMLDHCRLLLFRAWHVRQWSDKTGERLTNGARAFVTWLIKQGQ